MIRVLNFALGYEGLISHAIFPGRAICYPCFSHAKIFNLFPQIPKLLKFESFLSKVGFTIDVIRRLFNREDVNFSGKLYSREYGRNFDVKNSIAKITTDKEHNPKLSIDNVEYAYWFDYKKKEELKAMGININEPNPKRGVRM